MPPTPPPPSLPTNYTSCLPTTQHTPTDIPNTDLISSPLNPQILSLSDEWFASASNLTTPTPPIRKPGVFTHAGAWYDGWETRRHNPEPFDFVVWRLGVRSGRVRGVEVDTAWFDGNHAPEVSVEGYAAPDGGEGKEVDNKVKERGFEGWETILPKQECGPSRRQAWRLPKLTDKSYTHIRLSMYPDGGIARFRLYGAVVPVFPSTASSEVFDLAATVNGGVAVACSDQHFGSKENLLLPGRGKDMGDGWETKRSRGVHVDWVVVKLGCAGLVERVVVDTAHFRGNFPQKVQVFAAEVGDDGVVPGGEEHERWREVLAPSKCGPDREHEFVVGGKEGGLVREEVEGKVYGAVKMVIIPDGGVKRLRVFGRRA